MADIKSPEEVIESVKKHQAKLRREQRQDKETRERQQATLEAYEDLRDDVITLVMNHKMTFEEIHARCGPTPDTLVRWMTKIVHKPQLGKVQSVLRILGYDLGVVPGRRKRLKEWELALQGPSPGEVGEPDNKGEP